MSGNPVAMLRLLWADQRPCIPTIMLGAFVAGAYYCILDLQQRRDFFSLLANLTAKRQLHDGTPMTKRLTGFLEIDEFLEQLVLFFWPVVNGESPTLSIFGLYFVVQLVALHSVVVLNGLRAGNVQTIMALSTIWGLFYQCIPWGMLMPVYWISFIWISPLAPAKGLVEKVQTSFLDVADAKVLPWSILAGLVIPSVIAALPVPAVPSLALKQLLLALWQLYPIYVGGFHLALSALFRLIYQIPKIERQSAESRLSAQLRMYSALSNPVCLIHLFTILFALSPTLAKFIGVTGAEWDNLTLRNVFFPVSPLIEAPISSVEEGTLTLLQYDLYFATGSSIVYFLYRDDFAPVKILGMLHKIILYGPAGAILVSEKEQDSIILRAAMEIEQADSERKGK